MKHAFNDLLVTPTTKNETGGGTRAARVGERLRAARTWLIGSNDTLWGDFVGGICLFLVGAGLFIAAGVLQ